MRNETVFNSLAAGTKSNGVFAYLRSESGEVLYSFLYGPESLAFAREVKYAKSEVAQTSVQPFQFIGTTGRTLKISNLLVEGGNTKSVRSLIEGLEKLVEPDTANGKNSPPVLFFSWGTQVFGPCVLIGSIEWVEESWLTGEPEKGLISFTLQIVPNLETPQAQIQAILPEQQQSTDSLYRAAQRAVNQPTSSDIQQISDAVLTDRQQQDAVRVAEDWLSNNSGLLPAPARRYWTTGQFSLTSGDNGLISFSDNRDSYSLDIGQYNGSLFTPLL